jgi:DNA-binding HxlR family transcriptional regulator
VLTQYCPIETAAEIVDPRTSHGSGRAVEYRLTEAGRELELEPGLMALGVGSP